MSWSALGPGAGQRRHPLSLLTGSLASGTSVTLPESMEVRVSAAQWPLGVYSELHTSNVNLLFPRKQFNTKTKDGFTVNTKVPSLKDQGKEYDGFTITITGDKYVRCVSVEGRRAGIGKCAWAHWRGRSAGGAFAFS